MLALFALTLALGIVLLIAFDPDVQTIDADELADRSDDARAFLAGDFLFVALYAVLSPIAIWRFGSTLGAGSPPRWMIVAVLLLVAAGAVDATENTLLLSSTGSVSTGRVDAAHALAIPKITLFVVGALLAIAAQVRAVQVLRSTGHPA